MEETTKITRTGFATLEHAFPFCLFLLYETFYWSESGPMKPMPWPLHSKQALQKHQNLSYVETADLPFVKLKSESGKVQNKAKMRETISVESLVCKERFQYTSVGFYVGLNFINKLQHFYLSYRINTVVLAL